MNAEQPATEDRLNLNGTQEITSGLGQVNGIAIPPPPPIGEDAATDAEMGRIIADNEQMRLRERHHRLRLGGSLLDATEEVPAVWGDGDEVLWAAGEALMLVGPTGVGKTTITGQLLRALLGLDAEVLGRPVTPHQRVLYLALDRPKQIRRSLRRQFEGKDRAELNRGVVIHDGPLDFSAINQPEALLEYAKLVCADVVIVDSLKDVVPKPSDEEYALRWNQTRQWLLAEGVEVLELHHQRKAQQGNKPNTIADVHGSAMLVNSVGSVVLLWGDPGDSTIELVHLKPPAEKIGPLMVEHDHRAGTSQVVSEWNPLTYLRNCHTGATLDSAARQHHQGNPDANQKRRTARKLDGLVDRGLAYKQNQGQGDNGQRTPARWFAVRSEQVKSP